MEARKIIQESSRAESSVSKGLAEAHQTATRSERVECVEVHLVGRMSIRWTERQVWTEWSGDKEVLE